MNYLNSAWLDVKQAFHREITTTRTNRSQTVVNLLGETTNENPMVSFLIPKIAKGGSSADRLTAISRIFLDNQSQSQLFSDNVDFQEKCIALDLIQSTDCIKKFRKLSCHSGFNILTAFQYKPKLSDTKDNRFTVTEGGVCFLAVVADNLQGKCAKIKLDLTSFTFAPKALTNLFTQLEKMTFIDEVAFGNINLYEQETALIYNIYLTRKFSNNPLIISDNFSNQIKLIFRNFFIQPSPLVDSNRETIDQFRKIFLDENGQLLFSVEDLKNIFDSFREDVVYFKLPNPFKTQLLNGDFSLDRDVITKVQMVKNKRSRSIPSQFTSRLTLLGLQLIEIILKNTCLIDGKIAVKRNNDLESELQQITLDLSHFAQPDDKEGFLPLFKSLESLKEVSKIDTSMHKLKSNQLEALKRASRARQFDSNLVIISSEGSSKLVGDDFTISECNFIDMSSERNFEVFQNIFLSKNERLIFEQEQLLGMIPSDTQQTLFKLKRQGNLTEIVLTAEGYTLLQKAIKQIEDKEFILNLKDIVFSKEIFNSLLELLKNETKIIKVSLNQYLSKNKIEALYRTLLSRRDTGIYKIKKELPALTLICSEQWAEPLLALAGADRLEFLQLIEYGSEKDQKALLTSNLIDFSNNRTSDVVGNKTLYQHVFLDSESNPLEFTEDDLKTMDLDKSDFISLEDVDIRAKRLTTKGYNALIETIGMINGKDIILNLNDLLPSEQGFSSLFTMLGEESNIIEIRFE